MSFLSDLGIEPHYDPRWRFYCFVKGKADDKKRFYLERMRETAIRRHRKILARATPFDPSLKGYFEEL